MSYNLPPTTIAILVIVGIFDLIFRGLALWRSGRAGQSTWFVALLILNTAGILPIIYLLTHKPVEPQQVQSP